MRSDVVFATISDERNDSIRRITASDYQDILSIKDKEKAKKAIAEMVYHRFHDRCIKPFLFPDHRFAKHYKNGFSMMVSGFC
jgi:hypothetical protein